MPLWFCMPPQFRFCYCYESKKDAFIINRVFHNVIFEEACCSYEGSLHCGQCLQPSTLHTSKFFLVKLTRVEYTLNSYSDQCIFWPISFQCTCDCVYVQGKSTFSQKRSGCVAPRRVAEHHYIPFSYAS